VCFVLSTILLFGCDGSMFATKNLSADSSKIYRVSKKPASYYKSKEAMMAVHQRIPQENKANMVLSNNNFLSAGSR
jgi:hypothetical protein